LLDADLIILGSPVYAHQISGQMKTVIDRLSYWLHLLPLAGKPGLAISTTASTGEMEILNYLVKMMHPMGLKPIGAYNVFAHFQGQFYNEREVERRAEKAAESAAKYLNGEKQIKSTPSFEELFRVMKESIIQNRFYKPGEYKYWVEHGQMEAKTYQELLDRKLEKK
jgi:multimeric flavodoxin WrbA